MFLSVFFKGEWRYSESQEDAALLVGEVLEGLRREEEAGGIYFPGEDAWFCIAGRRHDDANLIGGSNLRVAVNRRNGYGALVWFIDDKFHKRGGVYDSVWISDNPEPLDLTREWCRILGTHFSMTPPVPCRLAGFVRQ